MSIVNFQWYCTTITNNNKSTFVNNVLSFTTNNYYFAENYWLWNNKLWFCRRFNVFITSSNLTLDEIVGRQVESLAINQWYGTKTKGKWFVVIPIYFELFRVNAALNPADTAHIFEGYIQYKNGFNQWID